MSAPVTYEKGNLTSEEALMEAATQYCRLGEARLHDGMQGVYIRDKHLILLDSRLCGVQLRCVLAHEISHARHMDAGCHVDKWMERRADQEAALMLIDPMEYAYAETIYEGNVMGIARELNVVPWVVQAYRERLHDDPCLIVQ